MSVLAFQKLSGTLSTDGKILQELEKLNSDPQLEILSYYRKLYPLKKQNPVLVERNFNSHDPIFGTWGAGSPSGAGATLLDFGGTFFGKWTITAFDGDPDDNAGASKLHFQNTAGEKLVYMRGETNNPINFIGELKGAFRDWGYVHFNAHFIGYQVEDFIGLFSFKSTNLIPANYNVQVSYNNMVQNLFGDVRTSPYFFELDTDDSIVSFVGNGFFKVKKNGVLHDSVWVYGSQMFQLDLSVLKNDFFEVIFAEPSSLTFIADENFPYFVDLILKDQPDWNITEIVSLPIGFSYKVVFNRPIGFNIKSVERYYIDNSDQRLDCGSEPYEGFYIADFGLGWFVGNKDLIVKKYE